ncbi:MAG TPA: YceI family protein [Polyangiaceae bacterium]
MIERNVLFALTIVGALAACDNPAKDKSQATVSSPVDTAAAASSAAPAGAVSYAITPATSKVEWTGSKVTGSHDGSFTGFTGKIDAVGSDATKSKVAIDIDTTTLKTDPEKLQGHLKTADFFDVEKFPKASFVSTEIKAGGDKGASNTVTGNLTLHGVTKSISFPATIAITGDAVTASANFTINRKDFGLNYPGKVDDLIRDDVVIKLTIDAKKS